MRLEGALKVICRRNKCAVGAICGTSLLQLVNLTRDGGLWQRQGTLHIRAVCGSSCLTTLLKSVKNVQPIPRPHPTAKVLKLSSLSSGTGILQGCIPNVIPQAPLPASGAGVRVLWSRVKLQDGGIPGGDLSYVRGLVGSWGRA